MDINAPGWILITSIIGLVMWVFAYLNREDSPKGLAGKFLYYLFTVISLLYILTAFPIDMLTMATEGYLVDKLGFPPLVERLLFILAPIGWATIAWNKPFDFSVKVKHKW